MNASWKTKIGTSTQPAFPAGQGAKGSSGVAGLISRTNGAIGYVDVAYAIKNHIKFAAVRNKAGKFLFPSLRRIEAAATAFTTVPANNELHIVNPPSRRRSRTRSAPTPTSSSTRRARTQPSCGR